MHGKRLAALLTILFISSSFAGCLNDSSDDSDNNDDTNANVDDNQTNNNTSSQNLQNNGTSDNSTGNNLVEQRKPALYESELVVNNSEYVEQDAYLLFAANGGDQIILMDKQLNLINVWNLTNRLGNDFEFMPNGDILGIFKADYPENVTNICFGGCGGSIQIVDKDGNIKWRFDDFANSNTMLHHDVELLPNGNILAMAWQRLNLSEANAMGIESPTDIYYESIYEISYKDTEIVWEWHSIDHMVQDRNSSLPNYGNLTENYHKIDFNYNSNNGKKGDIMHANGFDYDAENQLIYFSVNFYNEIWVIDHSTNTTEAASSSGGNYGFGGDLVYRFGNPMAYGLNETALFDKNHHPNLIKDMNISGYGNMLVYSNAAGPGENMSIVYELELPVDQYGATQVQPTVIWNFSDETMYSRIVSGADRGRMNNTYIAEGDFGIWEVTPEGIVAWKFFYGMDKIWRVYVHYADEPVIQNLLNQL